MVAKEAKIVGLCAAYAVAGPAIILLNKHILGSLKFPFPYLLTCMGLMCASVASTVLVKLKYVRLTHQNDISPTFYLKRIMPIAACQALAMGFGTVAYLSLTVAFIQMLKAFTPVVTLGVMYLLGVESPSTLLTLSVVGISIGTVIAVGGEVQLDMFGLIIHEVSAVSEAIRVVLTQIMLQDLRFSPVESLYYMAPAGTGCMLVLVAIFELRTIIETGATQIIYDNCGLFLLASSLGFVLNVLSFWIILLTSSVMLKIVSVARTAGLVIFCSVFLHEEITLIEAVGYGISLLGFVWYNVIRYREGQQKEVEPADSAAAAVTFAGAPNPTPTTLSEA